MAVSSCLFFHIHLCAKLTYKSPRRLRRLLRRRQRFRLGGGTEKKIKIFTKTWKTKKSQKHRKNRLKSIKTSILEELGKNGRHHQILREKLLYIDLFSYLYDRKCSKTLPIHVRKRSYMSVHNCTVLGRGYIGRSFRSVGDKKAPNGTALSLIHI